MYVGSEIESRLTIEMGERWVLDLGSEIDIEKGGLEVVYVKKLKKVGVVRNCKKF